MGKLSPGIVFAQNEYITKQKLYALIDSAISSLDGNSGTSQLYDIVMSDLDSMRAIHTADTPSSPSTSDLMVGADGQLDVYSGSAWSDLAPNVMYLTNGHASFTLVTGTPVIADATSAAKCKLHVGALVSDRPLGIVSNVAGPGATATVVVSGVTYAKVTTGISSVNALYLGANSTCLSVGGFDRNSNDVLARFIQSDSASPGSTVVLAKLVH